METILLVEDDEHQRMLYRMELEDEGYAVIIATNGWEALELVQKHQPDVVVLDLHLPQMDGVELLGRMVGIDNALPVIIYSGYETFKDNFLTWVADTYLVKCSDISPLKKEIREVLNNR